MHRVLLVDDEIFARKGLRQLIDWEACGFTVQLEADNGEDALRLIAEERPDLVVTDIRMPVLDGLELIRRVGELLLSPPAFIIISGYDDFKYAQTAVRYGVHDFILKPVDEGELEDTLHKLDCRLRQGEAQYESAIWPNAYIEALFQHPIQAEEIKIWGKRLGISGASGIHYLFIECNDYASGDDDVKGVEEATALINEERRQIVRTCLPVSQAASNKPPLILHRNRFGFVLSDALLLQHGGDLRRFMKRLQRKIQEQLTDSIYVYAGDRVHGVEQLPAAYASAKQALTYKYACAGSQVVSYKEEASRGLQHLNLEPAMQHDLIAQVEEHQEETVIAAQIARIFLHFEQARFATEAVKTSVHHLVTQLIAAVRRVGGDEHQLELLAPMLGWPDRNVTLRELGRLFQHFVLECADLIARERKERLGGGIRRIRAYIEAHYRENINLKMIAAHFYMNPVYLGQLFRKTYGVYFTEFLLQLRIEEAKRLLRQSDRRIYEIAQEVGYNNADYFVTQFEKSEGVTPSEYRNRFL